MKTYQRLTEPLARIDGELRPTTWEDAIDRVARGLDANRGTAVGMFSCSKATNEMNFMAQKFSRVVLGSNNIDSCNRT
jgi:predicted molibdopterin-dependent oxidoreductase YjgC